MLTPASLFSALGITGGKNFTRAEEPQAPHPRKEKAADAMHRRPNI